jgi:hypothetical protein
MRNHGQAKLLLHGTSQISTANHGNQSDIADCSYFAHIPFLSCLLSDGIGRLTGFMRNSRFTFIVNKSQLESNIAEAVLLSSAIQKRVQTDITIQECVIQNDLIDNEYCAPMLNCVRGFRVELSQSHESSFGLPHERSIFSSHTISKCQGSSPQ